MVEDIKLTMEMAEAMIAALPDPGDEYEALGYPPALAKACWDPFLYGLQLKNGTTIFFREATAINKDWIRIRELEHDHPDFGGEINSCHALGDHRGIEIRVSEILWVTDAPWGS